MLKNKRNEVNKNKNCINELYDALGLKKIVSLQEFVLEKGFILLFYFKNFMVQITKATMADAPALNKLINSAYRGEGSKKGWTTEADLLTGSRIEEEEIKKIITGKNSFILKYAENEKITACVLLEKRAEALYLGMLSVSPELQGRGVGKELLKTAEVYAEQLKCSKIEMTVISLRHELIAWYQRHGYIDTGKRKRFPVEMQKFEIAATPLEFAILEKDLIQK